MKQKIGMDRTPFRILIVDDESLIRLALSMLFKKSFDVKAVASAEDALTEIRSQFYNLCFLDINLPGMNGLEAMKIINDISPDTKVAIMTGNTLNEAMKMQINTLAYEFIEKPFGLSHIKEIVNRVLEY